MQRLAPLRVCRICGLEANTEADLELFVKHWRKPHGRSTLCKKCHRESKYRTNEFVETFRERSPDGLIRCHFCEDTVTKLEGRARDSLDIHSLDEDHENWDPANKVPTHRACHMRYHKTGDKNHNWKGDETSEKSKRRRGRRS